MERCISRKPSAVWLLPIMLCVILTCIVHSGGEAAEMEFRSAPDEFTEDVTLPDDTASLTTWLVCGAEGLTVTLQAEGAATVLTVRPFAASLPPGPGETDPRTLPDAGIELVEQRVRSHVRPNPAMLRPALRTALVEDWENLPSPLSRPFSLSFVHHGGDVECYFDGRYAGKVVRDARITEVRFTIPPGSALGPSQFASAPRTDGFFPVDFNLLSTGDQPGEAQTTISDAAALERIPLPPPATAPLDLGVTATHQQQYAEYTYRSAFDGLPESFIFPVPSAQYIRAWMLCAVDDDPEKDPSVTARLTRYFVRGPYTGRARDCLADTTVTLPRLGESPAEGVIPVGSVTMDGRELPLYLVEIPLQSGAIQDILFHETGRAQRGNLPIGDYLDFELVGRLKPQDRPHPFNDDRFYPDVRYPSGVHVFGVTLEETPVEMEVRWTQPGNIFHGDETPELTVALRPRTDGEFSLHWQIRDVNENPVDSGVERLSLSAQAGEQELTISLARPQVGWYGIDFSLQDGDRPLLSHRAAFALLPPDTRQAGYESPYATWWFDHHYGTADPEVIGPMLLKAGFRRAAYAVNRHTEEALAPWKVTIPAVGWGGMRNPEATDDEIEEYIRGVTERFPHSHYLMIFHESIPNAPLGTLTAPELLGLPINEDDGAEARWTHALRLARLVREKFPELKIMIGNSGAASELIAQGLRRGFPEEYADYIGVETVGRTGHPERLWEGGLQGTWLLREIARTFEYDWDVTSCYETNYRKERLLGSRRLAEWYARDALVSHAYRFPYISIALLHDTGNSYNSSFWGATGLCERYPLLYPKKAYVAMATLTRVLDRVTLQREVPTGSNSIYLLEFTRADGMNVYALWTARGTAEMQLEFADSPQITLTDLYSRATSAAAEQGSLNITAGTAVQYLETSGTLRTAQSGMRNYPDDQPPADFRVVNAMNDLQQWRLVTDEDPLLEQTSRPHLPFRTAGNFTLRGVDDEQMGPCLEVQLQPRDDLPTPLLHQYAVLRLAEPVTVEGEPTTLGLWVKGNSGWGQVYWEVEDAAGVRRISCGTLVHNADVFDYDGRVSVNYDGWAFLSFPLTGDSPIHDLSTGSVGNLWQTSAGARPVTYPIRITGVAFSVPQEALHLTEMVPVPQVLRFRDVGVCD